tara:strand:+ start:16438 stop:16839 length:402 start_codon:yes stop_codon:yes gene_type:complete
MVIEERVQISESEYHRLRGGRLHVVMEARYFLVFDEKKEGRTPTKNRTREPSSVLRLTEGHASRADGLNDKDGTVYLVCVQFLKKGQLVRSKDLTNAVSKVLPAMLKATISGRIGRLIQNEIITVDRTSRGSI